MIRACVRAVAAALAMCCGLLLAGAWQPARAAPVVFEQATHNGTGDAAGRFTAVLGQGSGSHQARLQLFTTAGAGSRISGLYLQDDTGAVGLDPVSGGPLVRLPPTQIHEVLRADPGNRTIAVIRVLATSLQISLGEARALVARAPTVIRTAATPEGNEQLKQALEREGASVRLSSRQDPSVPAGTNAGVILPGAAPTGYDVVLSATGPQRIQVLRLIRDVTGLSLAEARELMNTVPSVLQGNINPADAMALRSELQALGATAELRPVGGTGLLDPLALPPGSAGFAPDFGLGLDYEDPDATPALQLTLDLGVAFDELLTAWQNGQFVLGLQVTDRAGITDLYLAANVAPPTEVAEPPTVALLALTLFGLLRVGQRRHRDGETAHRDRPPRDVRHAA